MVLAIADAHLFKHAFTLYSIIQLEKNGLYESDKRMSSVGSHSTFGFGTDKHAHTKVAKNQQAINKREYIEHTGTSLKLVIERRFLTPIILHSRIVPLVLIHFILSA